MFDKRAFRSWAHVLVGASCISILFLVILVMLEEVAGPGARVSRAAIAISVAAFIGYVGTAWIIRRTEAAR